MQAGFADYDDNAMKAWTLLNPGKDFTHLITSILLIRNSSALQEPVKIIAQTATKFLALSLLHTMEPTIGKASTGG